MPLHGLSVALGLCPPELIKGSSHAQEQEEHFIAEVAPGLTVHAPEGSAYAALESALRKAEIFWV